MRAQRSKELTGHELVMKPDELIVTKTDLKGKITYANRTFYRFAHLNEKQTIGAPHNIIRHPEMPRAVFQLLWDYIQNGEEVFAYVNNRAMNGDNYWVFAHVTPSLDGTGKIIGYHSNRRAPNRAVLEKHIIPLYQHLWNIENSSKSPRDGLQQSYKIIQDMLEDKKMSFNQLMFALEEDV